MAKDTITELVYMFISTGDITDDIDVDVVPKIVCQMYALHKTTNINEFCCRKMLEITGKFAKGKQTFLNEIYLPTVRIAH